MGKTLEQAAAAGARDARDGRAPTPPRDGPRGSAAHGAHLAYLQGYRDQAAALPTRKRNPRRHTAKWDRCVKAVRKRGKGRRVRSAEAVCTSALKLGIAHYGRRRMTNPRRVAIYAQRPGGPVLKFLGGGKFARRGRARLYDSAAIARAVAQVLRDNFPHALKRYRLFAR